AGTASRQWTGREPSPLTPDGAGGDLREHLVSGSVPLARDVISVAVGHTERRTQRLLPVVRLAELAILIAAELAAEQDPPHRYPAAAHLPRPADADRRGAVTRSEEHTSELQSRANLVC